MAENRRDVNLVIRAKDEASRAFEQATAVLEQLVGINARVGTSANDAAGNLAKLADVAITLDKVYTQVNGAADRAAQGFARQEAAIAAQRTELQALQAQAKNATAAIERLNSAEAIVSAGRNQAPRLSALAEVTAEYNRLEQAQQRLQRSIAIGEAELNGQRSSLQQIGSTAIAVEQAQGRLAGAIDRGTTAMQQQAKAASVLETVNRNTGVTRGAGDYEALVAQIQRTAEAREQEITAMRAEEAATAQLSRAKEEQTRINQLLGVTETRKSAQGSASVFQQADVEAQKKFEAAAREASQAAKDEEAAIARLKAEVNPLAAAEAKLAIETQRLSAWHKANKISTQEHDAAVRILKQDFDRLKNSMNGIDSRGRPALFGLKPYEVQNLGFQVNDIVTQLASGTSLSQTLAQQGGQLIQLFPRVGSAVLSAFRSGPILAFVATIGTLVMAMHSAMDEAERLRTFNAILAANVDGAQHSAEALSQATRALDQYGISAEDALSVVRTLFKEGFDDSQIVKLGMSAKNLADVLGIEVTDAAKQVADAFHGGYDDIKKLDDATNFLTESQREHIKTLFEQGKAEEARSEALDIFSGRMEDAAAKMRGPWSDAARSLGNAWSSFIEAIGDSTWFENMGNAFDKFGRKVNNLINQLRGVRDLANVDSDIQDVQERQRLRARGGAGIFGSAAIDLFSGTNAKSDEAELNRLLQERSRILSNISREQDASGNATKKLSDAQKKANDDLEEATTKLKAQGGLINDRTRLQIEYNEALLDAQRLYPNSSPELQRQYALTKQKILQVQLDKQHAAEAKRAADEAERERKEREKQARDPVFQSVALLKQFEGFTSKAKFDVNAFRVGFGSDTVTRQDGSIGRVTAGTTVSMADAVRDLERRIGEFQNVIKQQIGSERFGQFSAQQQAALTSIAYNYGSLPDRIIQAVKTGSSAEIAAAVRGLAGDNGGVNAKRRFKEANILGVDNLAVDQGAAQTLADLEKDRLAVQTTFNEKLKEENDSREHDIASLQAQQGLIGDALLAEQRKEFIADSVLKKQQEIDRLNAKRAQEGKPLIVMTEEQKKKVEELAAAYFDLAHAKDASANARDAVEKPLDALNAQKEALQQQIQFFRENGQNGMADRLLPELDALNSKLKDAIANNIKFWESVIAGAHGGAAAFGMTNEQIQAMITGLETASMGTDRLTTFLGLTAQTIGETFASGAVNALDQFAEAIANGHNVLGSLRDAFIQFAADFLRQIAQMILKQIILNAVMAAMRSFGLGVPVAHTGGVVGSTALPQRNVSPALFANAIRYHTGGIVGLRPNEVPAILKTGEEVITAEDPRHRKNGGLNPQGGAPQGLRQVLAIGDDEIASAMSGAAGERTVMTHLRRNKATVRQILQD